MYILVRIYLLLHTELMVIFGHRALALIHLNGHRRLVILVGREGLTLFGRDNSVAVDDFGHYATYGLDTCIVWYISIGVYV